jgi:hypothetical protein
MKLAIVTEPDEVVVWAMLDDDCDLEPHRRTESFCIGSGATLADACKRAQIDLEGALEQLAAIERSAGPAK